MGCCCEKDEPTEQKPLVSNRDNKTTTIPSSVGGGGGGGGSADISKSPGSTQPEDYTNAPPSAHTLANKKIVVAQWGYQGDESNEQLAFHPKDEIIVLEEDEESGWWWGMLNGREGYFPVNYTKPVEETS
eukprot:TRINITY_DN625_c0_g1_i2.p1 TRINITY_DN625_c0_g1~~TRINITY_DN625_c0_g1_i2.p1  ORF type:complete len:130 (-),score=42.79 TRINITY_DN625_c0_g1_i2:109-498(-)